MKGAPFSKYLVAYVLRYARGVKPGVLRINLSSFFL
jgi:hypothetical protein